MFIEGVVAPIGANDASSEAKNLEGRGEVDRIKERFFGIFLKRENNILKTSY